MLYGAGYQTGEVRSHVQLRTRAGAWPKALGSPVWALLAEQKGAVVQVNFLYTATPEHPVHELTGRLLYGRERAIGVSLDQPLPMNLHPRTRFSVSVVVEGAILHFQSQAHEAEPFGGGLLVLKPPKQVSTLQRRQFARAPLSVPVRVYTNGLLLGEARSTDISAGGMRMISNLLLIYDQKVSVSFQGSDGVAFQGIAGKIVRVEPNGRHPAYAVRFDSVPAHTESALIKLVNKMQALHRRR